MSIPLWIVLAATAVAAGWDARTHRIPNPVSLALACAGICTAAVDGWFTLAIALAIGAAALVAGTVLFSFKLLGGGDVKLIAAAMMTLGAHDAPLFLLATILCGGVLGIAYAMLHGRLRSVAENLRATLLPAFAGVRPVLSNSGLKMPYGIAIFGGALCTVAAHLTHVRLFS